MTLFIHTADWQIGKPFYRVQDIEKRLRLQQQRLDAIGRIRDAVSAQTADFVLVAGDLFDSTTPLENTVLEVLEMIGEMDVPVLVIPGNHDHGAPGTVWHREDFQRHHSSMAPNLRVLLERKPVEVDHAVVLPCPLLRNQDADDPTSWLRGFDWNTLPAKKARIVLAHGGVQGFGGRDFELDEESQVGTNNQLDLSALPTHEIDYIALGDWHNLKQVSERAWYSGTPEPDTFDKGENNQRGQVLLVEAERAAMPRVKSVATGRFRWHNIQVAFHSDDDLDRFERQINELTAARVNRDLLRVEASGTLSLAAHARYDQLLRELESRLLRLRIKGECQKAPEEGELQTLTLRAEDPLIASVAGRLRDRLQAMEDPDSEDAACTRAALSELFRLTTH